MPAQKIIASLSQSREVTMKVCIKSLEAAVYALQVMLDGAKTLHISQDKIAQALSLLKQTRQELQTGTLPVSSTGKRGQMRTLEPRELEAMRRPSRGHNVPGMQGWACDPVQGKIT